MIRLKRKKVNREILQSKLLLGWCEWCQLDELNLPYIKAKIDTGAKTSALHAFNINPIVSRGQDFVTFDMHPIQRNNDIVVNCVAPIVDHRYVMSSNGHKEHRFVISTLITLGDDSWEIEITLSNRDPLQFRMLLGREALGRHVIVAPYLSYCQGKISETALTKKYRR